MLSDRDDNCPGMRIQVPKTVIIGYPLPALPSFGLPLIRCTFLVPHICQAPFHIVMIAVALIRWRRSITGQHDTNVSLICNSISYTHLTEVIQVHSAHRNISFHAFLVSVCLLQPAPWIFLVLSLDAIFNVHQTYLHQIRCL